MCEMMCFEYRLRPFWKETGCLYADVLIEERIIKQGLSNWRFTEVVSGLEPGELVVTSVDREGVKPGIPPNRNPYPREEPINEDNLLVCYKEPHLS
jgi:hypothetical protein